MYNASFLAVHGFSLESLDRLQEAWHEVSELDLLPFNYVWLTVRAMTGRSLNDPSKRMKDFFIAYGLSPELSFADLQEPRLVIVSADLNTGQPFTWYFAAGESIRSPIALHGLASLGDAGQKARAL